MSRSDRGGLLDRLVGGSVSLLVAAAAVWLAVQLVGGVWVQLVVIGGVFAALAAAVWWLRRRSW